MWLFSYGGQPIPRNAVATLGAYVRWLRKRQRLTQEELAGVVRVSVRFLSELENDKPTLQLDRVLRVLDALNAEISLDTPAALPAWIGSAGS